MNLKPFKLKIIFAVTCLICLFLGNIVCVYSQQEDDSLKFVYIADLNLYPTPIISQRVKHDLEKEKGLLIYESQTIFQDIVKYINKKLEFDVVIFGGNNIFGEKQLTKQNYWNLFLDMASEIKSNILIVLGKNEIQTQKKEELLQTLNSFGVETKDYWWSYGIKNYLLVGLDSSLFFDNNGLIKKQLAWLRETLGKDESKQTLIFMHKSLFSPDGKIVANSHVKEFFKIIEANPQVILTISAGEYLNRVKLYNNSFYIISSSPVVYPCAFKYVEVTPDKLKFKTINITLKGVTKKAEKHLLDSNWAMSLFPSSVNLMKNYVLGKDSEQNFEVPL